MPELPEVEAVRRALVPELTGRTVEAVRLLRPDIISYPKPENFCRRLENAEIAELIRRGKYMGLQMDDGSRLWLHFRMTGKLSCVTPEHPLPDHTHAVFTLSDGRELRYYDARRFGRLWALAPDDPESVAGLDRLGPEPCDTTPAMLAASFAGRKRPVKSAITDQQIIAGLGNIYADEILHRAGIHPCRPAGSLTDQELGRLTEEMMPVLEEAVSRGVSCSRELFGEPIPRGQKAGWRVYERKGQPCIVCGTPLEGGRIAGRSSVWCPQCQK